MLLSTCCEVEAREGCYGCSLMWLWAIWCLFTQLRCLGWPCGSMSSCSPCKPLWPFWMGRKGGRRLRATVGTLLMCMYFVYIPLFLQGGQSSGQRCLVFNYHTIYSFPIQLAFFCKKRWGTMDDFLIKYNKVFPPPPPSPVKKKKH